MTIIQERAALLDDIKLDTGSHSKFEDGHCAMEVVSWLADEGFTDAPKCASPVLARYVIRLNDRWDDERRQTLKPYLVRMIGTGGDGKDPLRERIAADFLVERLLGDWLALAGMSEHMASMEGKTGYDLTRALLVVRDAAWEKRRAARAGLRARVKVEVEKQLADRPDAVAAAAAVAAAVAVAVADAVAAAVADAVAAAVAAAVAVAAADADAVADAVAVADADAGKDVDWWGKPYNDAYLAARKYYDEHPLPAMATISDLAAKQQPLALELLDAMIDPAASR